MSTYISNIKSSIGAIRGDNYHKCLDLLMFLKDKYPNAPGSSHNHQAFKGGYYKHISSVLDYANELYHLMQMKNENLNFSMSDVTLVLFLHDIEKPIKYSEDFQGENDDTIRQKLIKQFDITLTKEQELSIKYIHGEGNDYKKDQRIMSPLCAFCHCCDVISSRIFYD
jgi:hypothetical protein